MLLQNDLKIYIVVDFFLNNVALYFKIIVGNLAWIARNLQNMENSIFGPKPAKHINIDDSDFDAVDANDTTPSIIENSDVEIVKLSKKKNVIN